MPEVLESIGEQIRSGDLEAAESALSAVEPTDDNRGELMFLRGYLHEHRYEREEALAAYEALLEEDPDNTEAAFRAALICDQGGDEDRAVELYRRCTDQTPAHVNALMNLAVIYEERGALVEAEAILKSVLAEQPNHVRAYQFLKSVESSYTMAYDEHFQREREGHDATLDVPVSDFELSVRSRNCLKQMNIRTLGDLLRITEPELLSYRNFGETSLNEIKAMLTQKGLRLGQELPPVEQPAVQRLTPALDDTVTNLRRPIAALELSVRSRKCLQRLGVQTLGELVARSEAELIALKNFGQTSLNEIKQQLATFGLTLRSPDFTGIPASWPPVPGPGRDDGPTLESAPGPEEESAPVSHLELGMEPGPEPTAEPDQAFEGESDSTSQPALGAETDPESHLPPAAEPAPETDQQSDPEPIPKE